MSTELPKENTPQKTASPWKYIVLPVGALIISLILAAVFYGRLPQDIAYRFSGGVVVSQVNRGAFVGWLLALQVVLTIISAAIVLVATSAFRRLRVTESQVLRTVFGLMGNMLGLPMIMILYAMLGIFIYNTSGHALPALWGFALVVLVAGGIILAVLFARAFAQSRKSKTNDISGSRVDVRD
jgi:uncharacterized membrane protein